MKEAKINVPDQLVYIATKLNEAGLNQSAVEARINALSQLDERVLGEIAMGKTSDEIIDLMNDFNIPVFESKELEGAEA